MSQENVEIVRGAFDAFNAGDLEGVVRMCDPSVEWFPPVELPGVSAYKGHEGVRQATREMTDIFGDLRVEPTRMIGQGNRVVVLFRWRGQGRASGVSLDFAGEQGGIFTLENRKAIRVEWYIDRAQTLEAARLSEQDAHADS